MIISPRFIDFSTPSGPQPVVLTTDGSGYATSIRIAPGQSLDLVGIFLQDEPFGNLYRVQSIYVSDSNNIIASGSDADTISVNIASFRLTNQTNTFNLEYSIIEYSDSGFGYSLIGSHSGYFSLTVLVENVIPLIISPRFINFTTSSGPAPSIVSTDANGYATAIRIRPGQNLGVTTIFLQSRPFTNQYRVLFIDVYKTGVASIAVTSNVDSFTANIPSSHLSNPSNTINLSYSINEYYINGSGSEVITATYIETFDLIIEATTLPDVHFASVNIINGWGTLKEYDESLVTPVIANITNYKGWSTPIAAANLLGEFISKNPLYFPEYTKEYSLTNPSLSSPPYEYPSWRNFTLDSNRPLSSSIIESYDCTDFGWFMNTNNLGDNLLADDISNIHGTSIENTHIGLVNFFDHIGYPNSVLSFNKINTTVLGNPSLAYTDPLAAGAINNVAAYKNYIKIMVMLRVPFMVTLNSKVNLSSEFLSSTNIPIATSGDRIYDITKATLKTTTQVHHDYDTPLKLTVDLDSKGNAYMVIGYIEPDLNNIYLPTEARNKFLVICKWVNVPTTGSPKNFMLALDSKMNTSDPNEMSMWDSLLSTHQININPNNWIIPRNKLDISSSWGFGACTNAATIINPVLTGGGVPVDNRFTRTNEGKGIFFRLVGSVTDFFSTPPIPLVHTFPTAGTFQYRVGIFDGVSKDSRTIQVIVADSIPSTIGIIRPNIIASISNNADVPKNTEYWLKVSGYESMNFPNSLLANFNITNSLGNPVLGLYTLSISKYGNINTNNMMPVISFNTPGNYIVRYSSSNSFCLSSSLINIRVGETTEYIDFTYNPITVIQSPIQFTDTSIYVTSNWYWDFGDGNSSDLENPIHTYLSPSGTSPYAVTMTADTIVGRLSITKYLTLFVAQADADFFYIPNVDIIAGITSVTFFPVVSPTGASFFPVYAWNFGDGASSNLQSPNHIYTNAGTYTITLVFTVIVNGDTLTDTATRTITVDPAGLIALSTTLIIPRNISNTVDLRDLSSNDPLYTYKILPEIPANTNIVQDHAFNHLVTYNPPVNYLGVSSYRYSVNDLILNRVATGKISYIVREPKLELLIGNSSSGFSVLSNPFGDYDISYGSIEINTTVTKNFILKNIGFEKLHISELILSGLNPESFQLKNQAGTNINSITNIVIPINEIIEFKITFKPAIVGRKKIRIKITHN